MRLHHLSISAFGPFAGTVEVDLDDLGSAGLFLLTGDTGAGKTSVLDAVCFGLYGEVPGDRAGARALHSDHADPDAEPRVVLVVGVGDRTFRFTRTPAWDRPRRRGDGTRRIQASVVVEEQRANAWHAVTTRLDEAGQLVGDLLGMTCTQFTQVAMLPQGRFQAFLRAGSADRHAVLQRLFRTQRFDDVERWLAERRRVAGRELEAAQLRCTEVLDRLCEAAGRERPPAWHEHGGRLAPLLDDGSLERWLDGVERDLTSDSTRHRAGADTATAEHARLTSLLTDAQALAGLRRVGLDAEQRLSALGAEADEVERSRSALDRHARSVPVVPLLHEARAATRRARESSERVARARQSLAPRLRTTDVERLEAHHGLLVGAAGLVRGWVQRERRVVELRREAAATVLETERLGDAVAASRAERTDLAARLDQLDAERHRLVGAPSRATTAAADVERARVSLAAAQRADGLREQVADAVSEQQQVTARAQQLREAHLDLWEQRISGAAGELAARLAAGCSCPVCGSLEHPSPAAVGASSGQDDEAAARALSEDAEAERMAVDEALSALRSHLAAAELASGSVSTPDLVARLVTLEDLHREADTAVRRLARVEADLDETRARVAALDAGLAGTEARLDERSTRLSSATRELVEQETALAELLAAAAGADGERTVSGVVRDLEAEARDVTEVLAALREHAEAAMSAGQATTTAERALDHAGFDDAGSCEAAHLDDGAAHRARQRVEAWEAARLEAEHVLRQPGVAAAAALPAPPVDDLTDQLQRAAAERDAVVAGLRAAERRSTRSATLRAELADRCRAWAPLRERHDTVARLASLVEGTGADNRLRMRLSGYVLSERLRQVVAAANQRLATMTDQRFALEHAEEKGAGEQRGGLSLRVRDDWTGTRRDPATLSGGESFQVSLALALGLADTVAHEAGGTTLDTLFVDEGFGALDAQTLDAVMDVLDELRDGGRVVGLVSHVAELRARIPAQLEVRRGRDGSTLGRVTLPA